MKSARDSDAKSGRNQSNFVSKYLRPLREFSTNFKTLRERGEQREQEKWFRSNTSRFSPRITRLHKSQTFARTDMRSSDLGGDTVDVENAPFAGWNAAEQTKSRALLFIVLLNLTRNISMRNRRRQFSPKQVRC